MQAKKLARNLLKCVPVMAVLAAVVVGLLIGQDLSPITLNSHSEISTQLNQLAPAIRPGGAGECVSSILYTSLPLKCRTADGSFIQADGISRLIIKIPGTK